MDTLALLGGGVKDFDIEKPDFRKIRPKCHQVPRLLYRTVVIIITCILLRNVFLFIFNNDYRRSYFTLTKYEDDQTGIPVEFIRNVQKSHSFVYHHQHSKKCD